ncbi:MAG: glycosyltransferase family 9 protein [Actinobacteria bacterium]|nr:MAG: glycosyltransferase family 9 protein [Actinomycetota bacterium]
MELLVNFWYAHPVGHAVEALRYCLGYHEGDHELEISLLLNGATATDLAACCPFVRKTYAVDYVDFLGRTGDPDAALAAVPREWDYVLDDQRSRQPSQLGFGGVRAFYQASHRHFRARIRHGTAGSEPPAYVPNRRLRLELPAELRQRVERELGSTPVRIALMPAGSSEPARYPSVASWELIAGALAAEFPEAVFCLVAKLERDGRTSSSATTEGLDRIAAAAGNVVRAVDLPLLEQLAYVEACSVFVSPHTGFGCAVLAVGTPWLALSGGPWHEWLFNGVPFWSVIPDTERYPSFTQLGGQPEPVEDDGPRTPSMTRARIERDLPELLEGARVLVEGRLEYEDALRRYFPRLLEAYGGDRSRVFSFDGIHRAYI